MCCDSNFCTIWLFQIHVCSSEWEQCAYLLEYFADGRCPQVAQNADRHHDQRYELRRKPTFVSRASCYTLLPVACQ